MAKFTLNRTDLVLTVSPYVLPINDLASNASLAV